MTSSCHLRWAVGLVACLVLGPNAGWAADEAVRPGADVRFAAGGDAAEVPDFQRHVSPLLGRLGCNTRNCHGSFQGRGGFRLSLFGYDFATDHAALTRDKGDEGTRRVDLERPAESLILQKPTTLMSHEGGQRFEVDSWSYHLLARWIQTGAPGVSRRQRLERLVVTPAELVAASARERHAVRVEAVWEDGWREDVTCLCRFQVRDEAIASVTEEGVITTLAPGDTHLIAFYDNEAAVVPILLPYPGAAPPPLRETASSLVDRRVLEKLQRLNLTASPVCTDAEFLRRVRLDLTGTLPTAPEVEAFLADSSADKRRRKIDELLTTPEYAAWWANKLSDYFGNSPQRQGEGQVGQQIAMQWYSWLQRRLEENVSYREMVRRILLANSRDEEQSYVEYAREMSSYFRDEQPADFSERQSMPWYWARTNVQQPDDKAIAVAHSFLGVRLHCAQCHKHPYDRWTQDDFKKLGQLLNDVQYGVAPDASEPYRELASQAGIKSAPAKGQAVTRELLTQAEDGKTIPWREVFVAGNQARRDFSILGQDFRVAEATRDPRAALWEWFNAPDNPLLARAIVNRVWSNYFHVGIVEPTDDFNAANPPSNAPLLEDLTQAFIAQDYDLRWLHREICNSATYQRSAVPSGNNGDDLRNFSHATPRRLPAETVYDALSLSAAAADRCEEVRHDWSRRAIGRLSLMMTGTYAMRVFGKPERTTACDCERSSDVTLLQFVFLQNDPLVHQRLQESGWLQQIAADVQAGRLATAADQQALIVQTYLRVLGRHPSAAELQRVEAHFAESDSLSTAARDLLWALWNTREFVFNH